MINDVVGIQVEISFAIQVITTFDVYAHTLIIEQLTPLCIANIYFLLYPIVHFLIFITIIKCLFRLLKHSYKVYVCSLQPSTIYTKHSLSLIFFPLYLPNNAAQSNTLPLLVTRSLNRWCYSKVSQITQTKRKIITYHMISKRDRCTHVC